MKQHWKLAVSIGASIVVSIVALVVLVGISQNKPDATGDGKTVVNSKTGETRHLAAAPAVQEDAQIRRQAAEEHAKQERLKAEQQQRDQETREASARNQASEQQRLAAEVQAKAKLEEDVGKRETEQEIIRLHRSQITERVKNYLDANHFDDMWFAGLFSRYRKDLQLGKDLDQHQVNMIAHCLTDAQKKPQYKNVGIGEVIADLNSWKDRPASATPNSAKTYSSAATK